MRKLTMILVAMAISIVLSASSEAAEKRLALVIGNSAYKVKPLPNPVNDAKDMEKTLRSLGFEVAIKLDASQKDMEDAIRQFGKKLRNFDVGLFYFAGHGNQYRGENYLAPTELPFSMESELKYKAVHAGMIVDVMKDAGNRLNILILDACRSNPLPSSSMSSNNQGLARMDAPHGMLIAYATAPNTYAYDNLSGRNTFYTGALLKHMKVPNVPILDMLMIVRVEVMNATKDFEKGQQVPWEHTSLTSKFFFAISYEAPPPNPDEPAPIRVYGQKKHDLRKESKTVSDNDASKVFKIDKDSKPLEYMENEFEDNINTITDHATGLMWQKSGSPGYMYYKDVPAYIEKLKHEKFAGYDDWRLPTVDELKSLLTPEKQSNSLHISIIFEKTQAWCWTSDQRASGGAWYVKFDNGNMSWSSADNLYVRAVRSSQ